MLIFVDLDGTLINTALPAWEPYRKGQLNISFDCINFFDGAVNFVADLKQRGHKVIIVSNSYPEYVNYFANKLGVEGVSMVGSPDSCILLNYIEQRQDLVSEFQIKSNCFMVGDTGMDVELGRRLEIPTILLRVYSYDKVNNNIKEDPLDYGCCKKMGPTFTAFSYEEVKAIIECPVAKLPSLEAAFAGYESHESICFSQLNYNDGTYARIICLARQEQGECDQYARADRYFQISHPNRPKEFLRILADGVGFGISGIEYLGDEYANWDIISYLTDKSTTQPPNKMKEVFDYINSSQTKMQLLTWDENSQGSLRQMIDYGSRQAFLNNYLHIRKDIDLRNKNVIVVDDQLTTGATAYYVIKKLRQRGVANILFIALFQMILPVTGKKCPYCGKPMIKKIKRADGNRFYSCVSSEFGGSGCGHIENVR